MWLFSFLCMNTLRFDGLKCSMHLNCELVAHVEVYAVRLVSTGVIECL